MVLLGLISKGRSRRSGRTWGIVFVLFALAATLCCASFAADSNTQLGVVLLHGKTVGRASRPEQHIGALVGPLKREHVLVETPEMPWSTRRYLDADYETALNEIGRAVEKLKSRGASRIVVAGHSTGANAALAYAATRGGVEGVIMLAPGHRPDLHRKRFAPYVAEAKRMIDSGRGGKSACFDDVNQGTQLTVCTSAAIYYSYFDPDGLGSMPRSAGLLSPRIPLLYVVGTGDIIYAAGREWLFDKAPPNPLSRYVVIEAGHIDTPSRAVPEVISWLHSLP